VCLLLCTATAKLGQSRESLPLLKAFNMLQAFMTAAVSPSACWGCQCVPPQTAWRSLIVLKTDVWGVHMCVLHRPCWAAGSTTWAQ
jgi:hypothetical protein